MLSVWSDVKPFRLKRHDDRTWVFAHYFELPSNSGEIRRYSALLFRNKERTVFGIREFIGTSVNWQSIRQVATKVVQDATYRKSLISDDPSLPKMWRGR
jgi:hypothetical protein